MWTASREGHPAAASRSRAVGGSRMHAAWMKGSGRAQQQDDHWVSFNASDALNIPSNVHDKTGKRAADLRHKPDARQEEVDSGIHPT